jgi:hypothetical protein
MVRPLVRRLLAVLLLAGCGSMSNTLAQDLAWERWKKCDHFINVALQRIDLDGRIWVETRNGNADLTPWQTCMQNAAAEQASQRWEVATPVVAAATQDLDGPYYTKTSLAWVTEFADGAEVRHNTPPRPQYSWPMVVRKEWEEAVTQENPQERRTTETIWTWAIEGEETLSLRAGTLRTFKIAARNKKNGTLIYEMWYAPAARSWARLREPLRGGVRERELIAYKIIWRASPAWRASARERREALARVEDVGLDEPGRVRPPPELRHRTGQAHPVEHLLLAALLHARQRRLPPRLVVADP